jgi:hypothetical protein
MPVWWLVVFCIPGVGLALLPFIFFILGFGSENYEADRIDSIH